MCHNRNHNIWAISMIAQLNTTIESVKYLKPKWAHTESDDGTAARERAVRTEWLIKILLINIDNILWEFWIIVLMCFPFYSMCVVQNPPSSYFYLLPAISCKLILIWSCWAFWMCMCTYVCLMYVFMRIEQSTQ